MNARIVFSLALLVGLFHPACGNNQLPETVRQELSKYKIPIDAVSIELKLVDSQTPILSVNVDIPRNPASVMKLVTTLAALELLGPAYTWKTQYYSDGKLENGRLNGNLVLRGGGDPYMITDQFRQQLHLLKDRGLRVIAGDLLIDDSSIQIPSHNRAIFDGRPQRVYNVIPSASIVNFSATRIILQPEHKKIRIIADPPIANLELQNELSPTKSRCRNRWAGWSFKTFQNSHNTVLNFNGKYPARCGTTEFTRAFLSNTEYTYGLFKSTWTEMGGHIEGNAELGTRPRTSELLLEADSKPLAEVIRGVNKFSNNIMARQLLVTIGKELYGAPGTTVNGTSGIKQWLQSKSISMPELVIENGAGLSRISRISAHSLSRLLQLGWESSYRPEFLSSLALAAIDGTMRRRLRPEAPAGRVRIKTGSLNDTRSMAGYIKSNSGQHYSIVMLINHNTVSYRSGTRIQDALLRWILRL